MVAAVTASGTLALSGLASSFGTSTLIGSGNAPSGWYPGIYPQSVNVNGFSASVTGANSGAGSGRNHDEIAEIITSAVRFPGIFTGYGGLYTWPVFDGPTLGAYNFNGLISDFNDLQAQAAAAGVIMRYTPNIQAYSNWQSTFSAAAGQYIVPAYILNGGSTYGDGAYGGTGNGWSFTGWTGSKYQFLEAALWNANVMARWIKMWQALYNTSFLTTAGPYSGQTYTFGTHPLICGFVDCSDIDIEMNGNPTVPADFTIGSVLTQWTTLATTLPSTIPNIPYFMTLGYGPNSNAVSSGITVYQQDLLSSLQSSGAGATASDVPGDAASYSIAQEYLLGYYNSGSNSAPVWSPGGTLFAGSMIYGPTWGSQDYDRSTGSYTPLTNALVEQLMNVSCNILKAQYVFPDTDDRYYLGAWNTNPGHSGTYGTQAYGSTGIAGAIAAFGGIPSANKAYPYAGPP